MKKEFVNQQFESWSIIKDKLFDQECTFINCTFMKCIGYVDTTECLFIDCTFQQCDYDIGTLCAVFINCHFVDNNFINVYYSDVKFIKCKFTHCRFGEAYSSAEYIKCSIDDSEINDFDKLEKELVINKNLKQHFFIINDEPRNERWCLLNYSDKIEIFYMSENIKKDLITFESKEESIQFFKQINFIENGSF